MATEIPEDLKADYKMQKQVARCFRDDRDAVKQAEHTIMLIERIASLQSALEEQDKELKKLSHAPLCAGHADTWYTGRNHIESKSGCIWCDLLAEQDAHEQKWANEFRRMENRLAKFLERAKKAEATLDEMRKRTVFSYNEIGELCCEFGAPEYRKTDDGEAYYWCFSGNELPVADDLAELLFAGRDLLRAQAKQKEPA